MAWCSSWPAFVSTLSPTFRHRAARSPSRTGHWPASGRPLQSELAGEWGMNRRQMLRGLAVGLAAGSLGACGAGQRLASLPEKLRGTASFHGLPTNSRIVLDRSDDDRLARTAVVALRRELDHRSRSGVRELPPAVYLAISGGGENGAYGAGVLTAWSEVGTRPEFKAVTGVSTGALIAPFAFLGSAYDRDLERFYTTIDKSQVMISRGLITGVLGDSLYDSTPLLRTIRGALTSELIAE